MALIDVSDLLLDPDFTNTVTLIRRASSINIHGEHVMAETPSQIIASVQGLSTEDLVRMPEAARLQDMITVYFRGELMAESPNGYADIVVWQGKRYQVVTVDESFMNFGAGFTRAVCKMEEVSA
jgi:galactose-6-phosphate isomerase